MQAENLRFDDNARPSRTDPPAPHGGVLRALRDLAEQHGLDPMADLFNEARVYAEDGHLRLARERLNVLLGLNPDDAQARLLLAKVHVAGQRWQDALQALDEAQACGEQIPMELRNKVEEHLRADRAAEEEQTAALRARELGEVKALRQEAKKLRAENAQLMGRTHDVESETRRWAWTTTIVSVIGITFVAASLFMHKAPPAAASTALAQRINAPAHVPGTATGAEPTATPASPAVSAVTGATPAAPVRTTAAELVNAATDALKASPDLENTAIDVTVRDGAATLTGEVLTAKQRRIANDAVAAIGGIKKVNAEGVKILARRKGTEHTVQSGDTLSRISLQYYGESKFAEKIQSSNASTLNGKNNLKVGQTLKIPAVE
jgi:nucleoid-associated protein YgaU